MTVLRHMWINFGQSFAEWLTDSRSRCLTPSFGMILDTQKLQEEDMSDFSDSDDQVLDSDEEVRLNWATTELGGGI